METTREAIILAGGLMPADGARWVWLAGALSCVVASAVAYAFTRTEQGPARQPEPAAN